MGDGCFIYLSQWGAPQKYPGSTESSLFQIAGLLSSLLLRERIPALDLICPPASGLGCSSCWI